MTSSPWPEARLRMTRRYQDGFYLRRREAEGEAHGTIFYVHGLGESGLCYEGVACDARLAGWNHLVPDLLGYGRSLWPDAPLTVERHAESLVELLDHVAPGPVVLVGHSMGGVIGLHMANLAPQRVRFFFNVEGNVTKKDCGFSSIAAGFEAQAWLDGGYAHFVEQVHALADGSEGSDSVEVMLAYLASVHFADPRTLHLNSVDLVKVSSTETLAERYSALEVPSIYLHGSPRGTGDHSLGQLHDAGVKTLRFAPAGHWPFLDQHDAFVDAMTEVLDRL